MATPVQSDTPAAPSPGRLRHKALGLIVGAAVLLAALSVGAYFAMRPKNRMTPPPRAVAASTGADATLTAAQPRMRDETEKRQPDQNQRHHDEPAPARQDRDLVAKSPSNQTSGPVASPDQKQVLASARAGAAAEKTPQPGITPETKARSEEPPKLASQIPDALAHQNKPEWKPAASAANVSILETTLGSVTGYEKILNVAISLDATHVAFLGARASQQFVVLDGKSSPPLDWVIPESLEFSRDGSRLAYLIQTATDTQPVIDGRVGNGYFSVKYNRVFFSPDGKRVAYSVQFQDGSGAMVVDGVAGPRYDRVDFPIFSPDSQHLAYGGKKGKQELVVLDDKPQKSYDAVAKVTFSPNSQHLAYEATESGKMRLVLDGAEGKSYDSLQVGPGFSADSARLLAVGTQAGKLIVTINGRESPPYEALLVGDFVLSADGKRVAYAARDGSRQFAVVDGINQQPFDYLGASTFTFSPDSKRFAYAGGAANGGAEFIVVDGVRQPNCEGVLARTPFFSPDSKRVAYGAKRGNKWRMIVDGVEGRPYDLVEPPVTQLFSPDSQRMAYRAAADKKPVAVVDGVETGPFQRVGPISFSPDSKHVACLHVRDDKSWAVLDNVEVGGPYNPNSPEMRVFFDDSANAHFIATRKNDFVFVKLRVGG